MDEETFGLEQTCWKVCDNTLDLAQIWNNQPWRRREFGEAELALLRESYLRLGLLLSAIEPTVKRAA